MSDTSVTDQGDGYYVELPDAVHSPSWRPGKPGDPYDPAKAIGLNSPLGQISQQPIWNRGRDAPTTVANLGPQPQPPPARPPPPQPPTGGQNVRPPPRPWSQAPAQPQPSPPDTPLLSPTGTPPPIRQFTPYIPALPIRGPSEWGTAPAFARAPMGFEAPGIMQGVGSWFGSNGSGVTALLGLGGSRFAADFIKSYQQGMTWKSNFQRQQLQDHMLELEAQQKQETDDYADVWNTYAANEYKPVGGVSFDDAMAQVAQKYNDTNMINTLATSGTGGAMKLIQNRDSHWQDLSAANKAANKQAEDQKDLADWGVPGASQGDVQGEAGSSPTTAPMSGRGPAPPVNPNLPSAQAQPVAFQPGQPSQPETQDDRIGAMPDYQRQGIELLRGGNMQGVPKAVQPFVKQYADRTLGQMDDLITRAEAGKMSKDQIEQELRKINPAIAGEFAGIRDLDNPLPGGMSAINAHPFWRDIARLSELSVPGWRANDYTKVSEMQRDYTTGTSSRRMQAANNMADAAVPLLKALKNIPEGEPVPANWVSEIAAKKFTGDPRWVTLYNTVQQYVQESQSLASPTGRYFEGDVNRMMHELDIAQGPAAIRSIIGADADAATRRIQTLTDDYENTTRQQYPPHYNPKSTAILSALAQMDPDKGLANVPNLPPDLQGLGMGITGPAPAAPGAPATPSAAPSSGWGTLQ